MTRRPLATCVCVAALVVAPLTASVSPAAAQITVFDPANYTQNALAAARALQQVNGQIQALQNQAAMLQNMARQLKSLDYSSLDAIKSNLQRIDALMARAEGMAFDLTSTQSVLDTAFPSTLDAGATTRQRADLARTQARLAMEGYRKSLKIQAQVVLNVQADGDLISALIGRSQGASGQLQAQQAANQLQALAIKQDQQLQTLIAAQARADALERARQAQVLDAGRLATRQFIGSALAYTPH
ncbi:conjugal transfer protein TrbJ [Caulobacter sp. Root487D2Y]|uniref:P-type conjugative transfer protein TrbJ n=1 Tax=Caulobacter sp. Root487D2Y TaxID=1736547 RepID=UPI0006F9D86B|nr:P-type conjugative transfer protein TrbJ [Caulobacter sp. Root487D2Y]KQY28273.1 conjugal transfer protein TrbJ [Caulobacter sp. Root487D2Y]